MKRLTLKKRTFNARRIRRRCKRRNKLKRRKTIQQRAKICSELIVAPSIFAIGNPKHRCRTVAFFGLLRDATVRVNEAKRSDKKGRVIVDLTHAALMNADATLLFKAEVHRLLRLFGNSVTIRCVPPRNLKVRQVLRQTGLARLLHLRVRPQKFSDVEHWFCHRRAWFRR